MADAPPARQAGTTSSASQLYRSFDAQTGEKTFYSGPLSWLTQHDTLTSRSWLALQHDQVVSTSPTGDRRVLDPWAGRGPEHVDQLLEFIGTGGDVEGTGAGAGNSVTGNTRLDVSGPVTGAYDWATSLFD